MHFMAEQDAVITLLQRAKSLLVKSGWCQHRYETDAGRLSIIAAVRRNNFPGEPLRAAIHELALVSDYRGAPDWQGKHAAHLERWNDVPNRRFEEVLALFDRSTASREALRNYVIRNGILRRGHLTIRVAPGVTPIRPIPSVGLFWIVMNFIVFDRSALGDAERYGDCMTHAAGHYERWRAWQALSTARLISGGFPEEIATTEYAQRPRGRIVYETMTHRFVIYADKRLEKYGLVDAIKTLFGLHQAETVIRGDSHYRARQGAATRSES
jgi:hypothetical protein